MQQQKSSCHTFFSRYGLAMENITQSIRERAYAARLTLDAVLKRAGIAPSTFYRWERGQCGKPHPVTLGKIEDALSAIEREKKEEV